jgi:hypothetical protein
MSNPLRKTATSSGQLVSVLVREFETLSRLPEYSE